MKKLILLFLFMFLFIANYSFAQFTDPVWTTVGGNSKRNGLTDAGYLFGPLSKSYAADNSIWGMQIFSYGSKFVTSRYVSLSPLKAVVNAFSYASVPNSGPIWRFEKTGAVYIVMGFNDDKVYVRDFQQNGNDSIFALNAENGNVIWRSNHTVERGIIWTAAFTSNGDLILPGSGTKKIMRINHMTGDSVWTNDRIIPNTGAECLCVNGNTVYAFQGGLTTPKTLIAIDANTGQTKYSSPELPGDGDQEIPFSISANGIIYIIRDGGLMYSLIDDGTSLSIRWSRPVLHPVGTYSQIGISYDSSVYIPYGRKIYRLSYVNGTALDSSIEIASSGTINPRFLIGAVGELYVGNGASVPSEGRYYRFNANLQSISVNLPFPYNYYSGPAFGNTNLVPTILMTGSGTQIYTRYSVISSMNPISSIAPNNFNLYQNFPNPFNPETLIKFDIASAQFVQLKIYDAMGKETETLVNGQLNSGTYQVKWNASKYSSGIYYSKLIAGNFISTKKMMYIK
ncbi:MAG TPA: PQQ-binding-like beta-propeller repeat protein [Ignavibacteria bacterium]|nr:PQQ-binding-like beta-propeller repeat protein [Ignavibacteria bacterium]